MKSRLLILLFLFVGFPLWAQDDEFRVPDSLIAALEQNPKPDMNRVDALANVIDYCNKNRQYQKAQPYIDDLTQISEKLNNDQKLQAAQSVSRFHQHRPLMPDKKSVHC